MNSKFVMNGEGNFHIEVNGEKSPEKTYKGVAVLKLNDRTFVGVSQYYAGIFPTEVVFEIKQIDQEQEKDFVAAVIDACEQRAWELHKPIAWHPPSEEDMKLTRKWIEDQFRAGMTLADCIDWWMNHEQYNDIDDEDVCLERTRKIAEKYGKLKASSPGWEKKA